MRLGDLLLASGKIDDEALYRALGEQLGVPFVRLREFEIDAKALLTLPAEIARARRALPLMIHDSRLVVATDDPADSGLLAMIRFRTQWPIEPVLACPADLDAAIARHYPLFGEEASAAPQAPVAAGAPATGVSPERMAQERPIVRLVHNMLLNAVQRRASDIHLHPREHGAEVRFRIDGSLVIVGLLKPTLVASIVARIKVLADLDVTEHRLPQDGAIHVETPHGAVDMRVSVMPAVHGEHIVIRILDRSVGLRSFKDIGFSGPDEKRMRALLDRNQGMVLVTGPTGSGKTTTLYAALQELNNGEFNIVTVENPVEYRIDGLMQIQTHDAIGYDFARALRHILRHDPDIILIGEIRDAETAKIAVESSLTGHLVLSTLHTNSAVQTITRLIEIGIPDYLVTATLAGILAQRLARVNCEHCRVPDEPSPELCEAMQVPPGERFWRGAGCANCSGTGYRGRVAVYELLTRTPALRALIHEGATHDRLEAEAIAAGMVPLTRRAVELARAGTLSLTEAYRVRLD
jgi:type IV pilus assembly protein PilB